MPDLGCGISNAQLGSNLFERQHAFFLGSSGFVVGTLRPVMGHDARPGRS